MDNDNKISTSIALGKQEIKLVDNYREKLGLSRSAIVRFIINKFFLKKGGIDH